MSSELKKKLQTRNGHRCFVKKVIGNVHDVLKDGSDECRPKLESYKIALEKQQKDLELLDNQIAESLDADNIEKEIFERCDFDAAVQESICAISTYLKATDITKTARVEHSETVQNISNSEQHQGHTSKPLSKTRLPKLSLPRFDGDPTKWIAFWDSFASAIHDNDDLNDVDKFQYLKSLMEGSAISAISGLPLTSANYKEAVDLLKERFGDKQVVISKHMEILMQLPVVNDDNDLKKLRQLYDKTEATVRSLNGIGISPDTYGTFLTPAIMAKIPKDLRLVLSRKLSDEWDLNCLLRSFREELQLREKCALGSMVKEKKSESNFYRKQHSTTGAFHTNFDKSTRNSYSAKEKEKVNGSFWCTFCSGDHKSIACSVVTEPDARRSVLRRKGKCFVCLQSGHISRKCGSQRNCFRCGARHHTSICTAQASVGNPPRKPKEETSQNNQTVSTSLYFTRNPNNKRVLLQTARAKVQAPHNESSSCQTRILFDSCSQKSYVTSNLRRKLNLKSIGSETVMIKTFGKEQASVKKCDVVQLAVECADNLKVYINAYEIDLICSPLSNQSIEFAQQNYPYLQDLHLADISPSGSEESLDVDVMIGADFYWLFIQDKVVRGESNEGPVAVGTRLGYVLSGPLDLPDNTESTTNLILAHTLETECPTLPLDPDTPDSALKKELAKFWDYDTLGIKDGEADMYEDYLKSIKQNECHYEAPLPFKQEHPVIPDNYTTAHRRLGSLMRRIRSSPDILHEYDRVIKEQLNSGVIQEVKREEVKNVIPGTVHYIPHREVVREDKSTTKLRIVYDASSKQGQEASLNECLLPGPSLLPLIFDILMRFRLRKIALVGDLEKAFLNVEITPEQRDLLRFLWVDDLDAKNPKEIVFRFTRLVFGLVCSPFILNAVLRNHLAKYQAINPQFVLDVIKSLYVDDYASGRESVQECFDLYQRLKGCFKDGGFNMRKWATNSKELNEKIIQEEISSSPAAEAQSQVKRNTFQSHVIEEDEGYSKITLNNAVCTDDEIKVMGVVWDRNSDTLKFKFSDLVNHTKNMPVTKRVILSTTARFYDPLGLLSPITVSLKSLFQELCRSEVDWDTPLCKKQVECWKEVIKDMEETSVIETPRCVLKDIDAADIKSIQLHGFADASNIAYGANVYLRVVSSTGVVTQLMASKTRVAPLKKETTPRLELLAALTLAKLIRSVSDSLDGVVEIDEITCWSDSQVVLWWIRGKGKQYKQFVQNRVSQIRSLWSIECWRYCPTHLNPSDIASRGAKCSELASNRLWWNGPQFLMEDRAQWPANISCPATEISAAEDVKREGKSSTILNTLVCENPHHSGIGNVIQCEKFSSLDKLLRVTGFVLRFIKNVENPDHRVDQLDLTLAEIESAKILWHKEAQFHLEESKKAKESLGIFQDEIGVLRCKGRIQNSSLPYSTKFPILLPRKHHYTKLVILHCHKTVKHNGIRETLTELRMNYWIVKGRQAVKGHLSRCGICQKLSGKAYQGQPTPPLPDFRVADDPAFSGIGIDFAGPLHVKDIYRGSQMHKSYIAVFTCASTRAIHLELVPDLTADSFIRAFKRFIARRGLPSVVISDNGRTFHDTKVKNFSTQRNISWKFNVPAASWWGGFFEICVKLVKRSLKKVTGNAKLTYEELETVLVEIEGVLNSRPLTYVYEELTEPPLTPSCLVIGRRVLQQPPLWKPTREMSTSRALGKRARYLEKILSHFRDRWKKEYLTGIREYQKLQINEPVRSISVGDLVHIQQDKVPRLRWRLGRVTKLYPGKDGIVRAAEVATLDPSMRLTHIRRPILKLYPLEVRSEEGNQYAPLNSEVNITPVMDESIPFVVIGK